jgi:hypothetical protein
MEPQMPQGIIPDRPPVITVIHPKGIWDINPASLKTLSRLR